MDLVDTLLLDIILKFHAIPSGRNQAFSSLTRTLKSSIICQNFPIVQTM